MNIPRIGFRLQADGQYVIQKDPDDVLDYGRDISTRFPGRTIASATAVDAAGITAGTVVADGTVAKVRVSGGTVGQAARVTLRCTLDDGQISDLTLNFEIVQR